MTTGKCPQPWRLEVILLFILEAWCSPPERDIAFSKEEAIKEHDEMTSEPNQIVIYTDGSDNPFGVGAAAVIPSDNTTGRNPLRNEVRSHSLPRGTSGHRSGTGGGYSTMARGDNNDFCR